MLGALFALLSAATFGLNAAAIRRGVLKGDALQAMAITVPAGVPLFLLFCMFGGGFAALAQYQLPGYLWMAAAGIIHFVIGRYGNYQATKYLGAALSAPIQQLSILVSLVLALIFAGEVLTPLRGLGIALVMLGPLLMVRRGKKPLTTKSGFEPDLPRGTFWGAVCALGYGTSPLFIDLGLAGSNSVGASLAGGLISYAAASIVVLAVVAFLGGAAYFGRIDKGAIRWFYLSAVFVFLSQMFRYLALAIAPIGVVVPIQRLSVAFRLLFGWSLNKDHEVLNAQVFIGIGLSIVGAFCLTLSMDGLAQALHLDGAWADFLNAQWSPWG